MRSKAESQKRFSFIRPYAGHHFFFLSLFSFFFCLFRATAAAYGGSQASGPIGPRAAGLYHSHRNVGSKPSLQPTSQLTATLDP